MKWIDINKQQPPINKPILVYIDLKNGYYSKKNDFEKAIFTGKELIIDEGLYMDGMYFGKEHNFRNTYNKTGCVCEELNITHWLTPTNPN